MSGRIQRFWREPLLYFAIAGAAIFAVDGFMSDLSPEPNRIVITLDQAERLTTLWEMTWGRKPSEFEIQGIIRDHITEEIYYREALKIGLDINDPIIRRRLRQKMEFLEIGEVNAALPNDKELQQWFQIRRERYTEGPSYSLKQIYFAPGRISDAVFAKDSLKASPDFEVTGDSISLPKTLYEASEEEIRRAFGSKFYEALAGITEQEWAGPIESGFGLHLVKIKKRTIPPAPQYENLSEAVLRDWRAEALKAKKAENILELQEKYDIIIEQVE